jgi:hypothetical protein
MVRAVFLETKNPTARFGAQFYTQLKEGGMYGCFVYDSATHWFP